MRNKNLDYPLTKELWAFYAKWSDILVVLIVAWAARLAFMCLVPSGARSIDAFSWQTQAELLKNGVNPYHANTLFNWPPFWMQLVFVISKVADFLNVPFFRVLQVCLVLFESAVIVQVARLIQMMAPAAKVRWIVIIGIALNPIAILLICQHCNFDVIMALWLLFAATSLLRYNASNDQMDWLCACLFLGLGVLTKTVPLVFIPLLAGGFRRATTAGRLLGAALVLGPVTLGISIIFVLAPADVLHNVLGYRAENFYFGFPGLLHWLGAEMSVALVSTAFYMLGIGTMALTWRHLWEKHSLGNRETILYIALILMAIPALGPGFGGQYFYWFIPFLVVSYACFAGPWRALLIGFGLISAITFIIEYGLNPAYGYNFVYWAAHAKTAADIYYASQNPNNHFLISVAHWAGWMDSETHQTMERLPLFIGMLTIIVFGARILLRNIEGLRKKWVLGLSGFYALLVVLAFAAALATKLPGSRPAPAGNSASSQTNQSQPQN
ncbi:MAG TPA: hypothetical protein VMH30_07245 [Verrucomicrobiae bacterium]|nr:hypothetical protein [Verrucomicrobiae bacterium]